MIQLQVVPQFSLVDVVNNDTLVIKGSKTKGLIALLAFAPDFTRSRGWVRKKLWSDRSEEQAAGSLRQCLSDLGKCLGTHKNILISADSNLALDKALFSLDIERPMPTSSSVFEILEDLDVVKDPQFKLWLNSLRDELCQSTAIVAPKPINSPGSASSKNTFVVLIDKQFGHFLHENVLGSELLNSISRYLLEMPDVTIIDAAFVENNPLQEKQVRGCRLIVQSQANETSIFFQVRLESLLDRRLLWGDSAQVKVNSNFSLQPVEMELLAGSVVNQFNEIFSTNSEWINSDQLSSYLLQKAVNGIFSLNKEDMQSADRVLNQIYQSNPSGQFLAWRAFLRSLAIFQHRDANFLASDIASTALVEQAIRESPSDSVSLLVTSQFEYLHRGNTAASLHFAEQSVTKNPLNALAWAVLSNIQLVNGNNNNAVISAKKALALGKNSPYKHYLEFFACMALASLKEYDQATVHAEISLAYCNNFTAPLRYLLPLYKATEQPEKFDASLKRLIELEPDFSIQRYGDSDYPVNTLRKIKLIDFVL